MRQEIKVWLHMDTPKALLVSPTNIYHDAEKLGAWFPRSQIVERAREFARRGEAVRGTVLTLDAPAWLVNKLKREFQP